MKKLLSIILVLILGFSCVACFESEDQPEGESDFVEESLTTESLPSEEVEKQSYLKGIAEPFANSTVWGFNHVVASDLLGALGSKTFRMWLSDAVLFTGYSNTTVFPDDRLTQVSMSGKIQINEYISLLKQAGIKEIVGLGSFLPKVESTAQYNYANNYVPDISSDENSDYAKFLNKVYLIYKTVSATFPDITVWEMGNETNQNTFLANANKQLSQDELAHINVDYMYYATKGVKEGNPNAITIPAGFAPIEEGMPSIKRFYELIYGKIESGEFPSVGEKSTDKRDYFQGLCWHAYDISNGISSNKPVSELDLDLWKRQNDEIYNVAVSHGDGHLKAWITEFGFTLNQNCLMKSSAESSSVTRYKLDNEYYDLAEVFEQYQVDYCYAYFNKMDEMEYLNSVHFFRLFCSEQGMQWNGFGEVYFGMFLEPDGTVGRGFYPRKKAYAIQEIFGGTGDLTKYAVA